MAIKLLACTTPRCGLTIMALLALTNPGCMWFAPESSRGESLYNQGRYAEALPILREQAAKSPAGAVLYQLGYCVYAVESDAAERHSLWERAVRLLEEELSGPEGATLDRLYYLAAIHMSEGDHESMRRFSRRAVDEIEKGPELTALDGEDWFRLARIHDWLNETSEAEAAYRRAVSAFRAEDTPHNPTYRRLALIQVADLDFRHMHYEAAAIGYDEALALAFDAGEIRPFNHGLSLLAVGRFEDAMARFAEDRDPATAEESRLAAEIARMAAEIASASERGEPLIEEDFDGLKLGTMPMGTLENRIRESGGAFMQARNRHSFKPGDPLVSELHDRQKRFISLARERLIRTRQIQAFLDAEGLAELVRR